MKFSTKALTRTAIMLAMALAFQALRFIPMFNNAYLIGSLVNMVLVITTLKVGLASAVFVSVVTPIVAFLQGHVPFPLFIPMIALGNAILCVLFYYVQKINKYAAIAISSVGKWIFLYYTSKFILTTFISVQPQQFNKLVAGFNIPQLVTALVGGFVAVIIARFIENRTN